MINFCWQHKFIFVDHNAVIYRENHKMSQISVHIKYEQGSAVEQVKFISLNSLTA